MPLHVDGNGARLSDADTVTGRPTRAGRSHARARILPGEAGASAVLVSPELVGVVAREQDEAHGGCPFERFVYQAPYVLISGGLYCLSSIVTRGRPSEPRGVRRQNSKGGDAEKGGAALWCMGAYQGGGLEIDGWSATQRRDTLHDGAG